MLKPNMPGLYRIGLTVNDGWVNSAEDTITLNTVKVITGIAPIKTENEFAVYPNPAGIYLLRLKTANKSLTRKLVIQ